MATSIEEVTWEVLEQLLSHGLAFTALDVSNAVLWRRPATEHEAVARVVRDLFDDGKLQGYTRTAIEVVADGNRPARATLYHREGDDPDAVYGSAQREQLATLPHPRQSREPG